MANGNRGGRNIFAMMLGAAIVAQQAAVIAATNAINSLRAKGITVAPTMDYMVKHAHTTSHNTNAQLQRRAKKARNIKRARRAHAYHAG